MKTSIFKIATKVLFLLGLVLLLQMTFLLDSSIQANHEPEVEEPPAQEVYPKGTNPFGFEVDYLGEIHGYIKDSCTPPAGETFYLGAGYDYFIIKNSKGGFNFANYGPNSGNAYWSDWDTFTPSHGCAPTQSFKAIDVAGNNPSNYRVTLRPRSEWNWQIWRVKVDGEGFPPIDQGEFVLHNGDTTNYGTVTAGCVVNFLMMDDDAPETGDDRQQYWRVQKKVGANWNTVQEYLSPDGMVVADSFTVDESLTGELRLILVAEDSINMLQTEVCDTYSYQIVMKGVFISTGQREREGVGDSGFAFERNIFVPPDVAPLLIEYDPKYLINFRDLLGEALIDWVEVPN